MQSANGLAPARPGRLCAERGISLLELACVLALALVVVGWAVPSFSQLIYDSRRTANVNAFVSALHLARSEAVKRGMEAVLCKSEDGGACLRGDASGWHQGWLVFVNVDRDQPPSVDATEPVIHVRGPAPRSLIRGNREAFVFRPFNRNATNGTVVFCDERGPAHARAVIISNTGRPRISGTDPAGDALECDD